MALVRRSEQMGLGRLLRDRCSHHHRIRMARGLLGRALGVLGLDARGAAAASRSLTRVAVGRIALELFLLRRHHPVEGVSWL